MRKIVNIVLVALVIVSCNGEKNKTGSTNLQQADVAVVGSEAETSAYLGVYTGVLPCADCEGIKTELSLEKDNHFIKKTKYLGKGNDEFTEIKGDYAWDASEKIILLKDVTDTPNQYIVENDQLIQLDMAGKRIEGGLSEKYILMKKK